MYTIKSTIKSIITLIAIFGLFNQQANSQVNLQHKLGHDITKQLELKMIIGMYPETVPVTFNRHVEEIDFEMREFYSQRAYQPAWIDKNGRINDLGKELIYLLNKSAYTAYLSGESFKGKLEQWMNGELTLDKNGIADLEIGLSLTFLRMAKANLSGIVSPEDLKNPQWHIAGRHANLSKVLASAVEQKQLCAALSQLLPDKPGFDLLMTYLQKYQQIAENGGWPDLPESIIGIEQGEGHEAVQTLRTRLIKTDDLSPVYHEGDIFDTTLVIAVSHFQSRHGLEVDGKIGKQTFKHLNVTAQERLRQLEVNIERFKWLPEHEGDSYIWVNIPDFTLAFYRNGLVESKHRVVTGAKRTQTPCFSSYINNIVLNPYWNVPYSIAKDEIAPKVNEDAQYLMAKNYEVINGWGSSEVLDGESTLDWSNKEIHNNYRFRQKPGPGNALGLLKFNIPNKWSIYLHDTPSKSYFNRSVRAFSHGCVRVEHPDELAKAILASNPNWEGDKIAKTIRTGETKTVTVNENIRVHIVYMTAWVGEDGTLQIREDVYERDKEIGEALARIKA